MQRPTYVGQPAPAFAPMWVDAKKAANPRDPRLQVMAAAEPPSYFTDTFGRRIGEPPAYLPPLPSFLPPAPAVVEWVQDEQPARRVQHNIGYGISAPVPIFVPPAPIPVMAPPAPPQVVAPPAPPPVVAPPAPPPVVAPPAPPPVVAPPAPPPVVAPPAPEAAPPAPPPVAVPPFQVPSIELNVLPPPLSPMAPERERVGSSQQLFDGESEPAAEAAASPVAAPKPARKKRAISDVELAEAFRPLPRRSCVGKPVKRFGFE